ncbi:MAG: DUF192 domain-containing protein [Patescibacteria group bacterium]
MNSKILFTIILVTLFSFLFLIKNFTERHYLYIDNQKISLIIADSSETRIRGLSGMRKLAKDTAMLFVFDKPDKYGIWMKDMKFPIDIIWLDENQKIIYIEENISPKTYPKVFMSDQQSLYVLETNIDFVKNYNLKVGNILNISKK